MMLAFIFPEDVSGRRSDREQDPWLEHPSMVCWLNCQGAAAVSMSLGIMIKLTHAQAMTTMSGPPLASSDCKILSWQNTFWFQRCWTMKRKCNVESTKYIILLNENSEGMMALEQVNSVAQWCHQGPKFFSPFHSTILSIESCARFTAFMDPGDVRVSEVMQTSRPEVEEEVFAPKCLCVSVSKQSLWRIVQSSGKKEMNEHHCLALSYGYFAGIGPNRFSSLSNSIRKLDFFSVEYSDF